MKSSSFGDSMELINSMMGFDILSSILGLIIIIICFFIPLGIGKLIMNIVKKHQNKISDKKVFNAEEYIPTEEIETLQQLSYLIVLFLLFIIFLYNIFIMDNIGFFSVLEVILMIYIALNLDYSSWKNKILFFLLIPYGSLYYIIFESTTTGIIGIFHAIVLLYFMKIYYDKFKEFTETNSLGITILLLFVIIFISFIFTMIVEGVSPIDAINMVSNAFTSNGYAVLGTTLLGKLNSLLLVWSGYILSGVGTATLTVALLSKHFNKRINDNEKAFKEQYDELKETIERNNKEIKELIKENNMKKEE